MATVEWHAPTRIIFDGNGYRATPDIPDDVRRAGWSGEPVRFGVYRIWIESKVADDHDAALRLKGCVPTTEGRLDDRDRDLIVEANVSRG